MNTVTITTEYIRLDSLLKLAGMIDTGGMAKFVIQDGKVKVNGETCLMRGKKLRDGDTAEFDGNTVIVKIAAGDR